MKTLTSLVGLLLVLPGCAEPSTDFPPAECTTRRRTVENEGWSHEPLGTDISYRSNPPASGPHYPLWARYQVHPVPVPPPYWVHNLEHGAVVLLYRPDAEATTVERLERLLQSLEDPDCQTPRVLLTAATNLPTAMAAVAADTVLEAECVVEGEVADFFHERVGHGPEQVCLDGSFP